MSDSLPKTPLIPSDGVRVITPGSEYGFEGYVRKTPSQHTGEVLVKVTKASLPGYVGVSLSYLPTSLVRTRRNGK